jgi:hypothetical protein
VWEEYRAILGHALDPDAYMALAAGYSGLASAAEAASRSDFSEPISDAEGESLATTYLTIDRGLSYLGLLLHRPNWWHPLARRAFNRKTQKHIDGLMEKDRKYQDFMAKHGR